MALSASQEFAQTEETVGISNGACNRQVAWERLVRSSMVLKHDLRRLGRSVLFLFEGAVVRA